MLIDPNEQDALIAASYPRYSLKKSFIKTSGFSAFPANFALEELCAFYNSDEGKISLSQVYIQDNVQRFQSLEGLSLDSYSFEVIRKDSQYYLALKLKAQYYLSLNQEEPDEPLFLEAVFHKNGNAVFIKGTDIKVVAPHIEEKVSTEFEISSNLTASQSTLTDKDKQVLSGALKGEIKSLAEYLMSQRPNIIKSSKWKSLSQHEAEDVFSTATEKILRSFPDKLKETAFIDEASLRNWIQRIFTNAITDTHRQNKRNSNYFVSDSVVGEDGDDDVSLSDIAGEGSPDTFDIAASREFCAQYLRMVRAASSTKSMDILLRALDGSFGDDPLSYREMQELLAQSGETLSNGTLKTHKARALKMLYKAGLGPDAIRSGILPTFTPNI